MAKTIEEQLGEVKNLVVGIQSEHEAKTSLYGSRIAEADTAVKNMETKFADLTQLIQSQADEIKASKDTINEMTLAVARMAGSEKGSEPEMSDEVKDMFSVALRQQQGTYAVKKEVMSEIITAHVSQKFDHLSRSNQDDLVKSILAEGSSSAGGMWCPVPMDTTIRKRMFETSPLRGIANVMTVNTKALDIPLDDEDMVLQNRGEINAVTATNTPSFGEVRIDVHEIAAKPKATLQLLEDSSIDLASWLTGKVANKIARQQNRAFILGTGVKEAKGILTYADADIEEYERHKIGTMETATALTLAGDDLIDLQSHLIEDYQDEARYMMHRLIWAKVTKLKDLDGQYLLNPTTLFSGNELRLSGAPVVLAGDMPKPTTAGALVGGTNYVLYGNFREGYTILDRLGINVIMDNITQSGFVQWYFRTRYGGAVTNFQAIKRLKAKS